MLRKFFTPGLMLMVVAALAVGMTISAVQQKVHKHYSDDYGLTIGMTMSAVPVEDHGEVIQPGQFNANQSSDRYFVTIDPAAKQQLGEQTFNEVTMFFLTAEEAIETKNLEVLMGLYSDNYRDGDLDKKSVDTAWRRIFSRFDTMATLDNMKVVKVSADRNMVVLQSNGLLLGTPSPNKGLTTIDNWNKQDRILVKEAGKWQLIATYGLERKRLWFDKPMHPLF